MSYVLRFAREVAQNIVMAVPPIQTAAVRWHTLEEETPSDEQFYRVYRQYTEVAGRAILELGPGRRLDLLRMARRDGAARCVAVDVLGYRARGEADRDGIEYRIYDGRTIPYDGAAFDIVWSWAVFEHLRHPRLTVDEIVRVLKPGGVVLGRIDLRDHYHLVKGPWKERAEWLDCLRYPEWQWRAMKWYRAAYVNRLRYSEWLALLAAAGLEQVSVRAHRSEVLRAAREREAFLQRYSEDDVATFAVEFVYRKAAGTGTRSAELS